MRLILASELPVSFPTIESLLEDKWPGDKGVFIPTAAYGDGWDPDIETCMEPFASIGVEMESLDLRGKTEAQAEEALADKSLIYVGGGNTFFLLEHMQKCNFEKLVRDKLSDGAVYVGSSAGSVICTPDIAYIEVMDDPKRATLTSTKGLGLVDICIIPHLDHAQQGQRAWKGVETYKGKTQLVALRDDQLLYVEDRVFMVY